MSTDISLNEESIISGLNNKVDLDLQNSDIPSRLDSKINTDLSNTDILSQVDTKILNRVLPIGSTYIQFGNQLDPATLFGGVWENISSLFDSRFLRIEGSSSAVFGSGQEEGLPNILGDMDGGGYYSGVEKNAALRPKDAHSETYMSSYDTNTYLLHVCEINFDASLSNSIYGSATEVRPKNTTVRIWLRTD